MTTTGMFILVWVVVLANLLLTVRLVGRLRFVLDPFRTPPPVPTPPVGLPAPPFAAETLQGEPVVLSDYAQRSLTLVYISHHCPSCRSHLPTVNGVSSLARDAGGEVMLAVFGEDSQSREATRMLVDEFEVEAKVILVAADNPLQRTYNPRKATPFFCHIDRGVLRATGSVGAEAWQALVRQWRAVKAHV
jgi:hypothetical protein